MSKQSVTFRQVSLDALAEAMPGRELLVCQTPEWLKFLELCQRAEPLVLEVQHANKAVGLFVGAVVRKAGLRILGSPLRGWTTSYMGFALDGDIDATACLSALRKYAFSELGCAHLELLDRNVSVAPSDWQSRTLHGYEIDISRSEEELFGAMSPACRRCIRKAEKHELVVEEVADPAGFAIEFYGQLREVFARQGLVPPYPQRRVEQLIEALHPYGMLLLLRARDEAGQVIASSIFPGYGRMMYFWGGASLLSGLHNRPNEAMMWHAMRYWKARGVTTFDMGGGGAYKAKYGGTPIEVPWLRCSRSPLVSLLRSGAERALRLRQRMTRGR